MTPLRYHIPDEIRISVIHRANVRLHIIDNKTSSSEIYIIDLIHFWFMLVAK